MRLIRRPLSPLLRLTFAVTSIFSLLVLLADVLLGAFPSRDQAVMAQRQHLGEAMAVQVAAMLKAEQPEVLRATLDSTLQRQPSARGLRLRRADGEVLLQVGDPPREAASGAKSGSGTGSTLERVVVPLSADGQAWGQLELSFRPSELHWLRRWLSEPLVLMLALVSLLGTSLVGLYLRRALQHLDPMAVIPERVQGAFDVMNEGVAVLDGKGRVLLTNQAFQTLHPQAGETVTGKPLSGLAWLAQALPTDQRQHPWARTLANSQPTKDQALELRLPGGGRRPLLLNTMPIQDGNRRVQGCLVSFTDQSEIHRSNARLTAAMDQLKAKGRELENKHAELEASRDEVQRQNEELVRIATRDPMTGCLNRRAFNEAYQRLWEEARHSGQPLACLVLDIDHFKRVNDTHGHSIGDRVIQEAARSMDGNARPQDLVCRYGGEEFVMVLPGMDADAARQVAERVRLTVQDQAGPSVREVPDMKVTASIGVAINAPHLSRPSQMIDEADQALYAAKRGGRNQVRLAAVPAASSAEPAAEPA